MVLIALLGGRTGLGSDADAVVDIQLAPRVQVDAARQQVIETAKGTWQAVRVGEATPSDDETVVEFTLPGPNLDGLVNELRRYPSAESVDVMIDIDPEQASGDPVPSADGPEVPEPVRLEVNITAGSSGGPWITILGAVVVALIALGALALVSRRFGADDGAGPPEYQH